MRSQSNGVACDMCGSTDVIKHAYGDDFCEPCWQRRSNWDEGARYTALMLIGQAVQQHVDHDGESWAIYEAVRLALLGPIDPHDSFEGLHPDDGHNLAAHMKVEN